MDPAVDIVVDFGVDTEVEDLEVEAVVDGTTTTTIGRVDEEIVVVEGEQTTTMAQVIIQTTYQYVTNAVNLITIRDSACRKTKAGIIKCR